MRTVSVCLQPVTMQPAGMMRPVRESDIHMEADIHALGNEPNGFPGGSWIPAFRVRYRLQKAGSSCMNSRACMPMAARDGHHYGANVKLGGPGRYRVVYTIHPPDAPGTPYGRNFGCNTDRLTGVQPRFRPFGVHFGFI